MITQSCRSASLASLPHLQLCKEFFDFCTHPRIRGFGEEACGGRVRIGQSDVHIHRGKRDLSNRPKEAQERFAREGGFGFHGGYGGQFAPQIHHTANGLTHCHFMKCLTNLTDLDCPEDGGTSVIAGSHKIHSTVDRQAMVAAALENPSLIHNVVAPAGSTLIFFESLMHSGGSGATYNGKERILILASFLPTMYQQWNDYDPFMPFVKTLNEDHQQLLTGSQQYGGGRNPRDLSTPREHVGWGLGASAKPAPR